MIQLWQAIHNYFENDAAATSFKTALTGGLYNAEAPQDNDFPYGVFQLVSNVPSHHASSKNFVEECLIQFNLFSKKRSMTELLLLYDELITCFDFAAMSITGYTLLSCVRENTVQFRNEDVWQMNVTYRLELEPL